MEEQPEQDLIAEAKALQEVVTSLKPLQADSVARVVRFVVDAYKITLAESAEARRSANREKTERKGIDEEKADPASRVAPSEYKTFSDLYDAADPQTDQQKLLIAGYWLQTTTGGDGFMGTPANQLLRDLGHAVDRVPRTCNALASAKPVLVRQVQKQGSSRQARKIYKVTEAGKKAVDAMLRGIAAGNDDAE